jgi:hypothetical protein
MGSKLYNPYFNKPRIKHGAVINLKARVDNQCGTITRSGDTLRLFACVYRGGITIKKRSQTVTYPTVRIAKQVLVSMVDSDCEAILPAAD